MNPMQGPRSNVDSSVEVININGEPVSSVNSQTSLNNVLHPVDDRFSNYTIPLDSPAYININAHNVQNFNGWGSGEPSSRSGFQDQVDEIGSKVEHGLPSDSFHPLSGYVSEGTQSHSTTTIFPERFHIGHDGNLVRNGPLFLRGSSSNHIPQTVNLDSDVGYSSNSGQSLGVIIRPNNSGSSLGSSSQAGEENGSGSSSSLGGWGSSCKRKALEGASGHSFPGASTGCFSQAENGVSRTGSSLYGVSSSLSLSTPQQNSPNTGSGLAATNALPSTRNTDSSSRPFGRRLNPEHPQESVPFNLSSSENPLVSCVSSLHQLPISEPSVDPLDVRSSASEPQPNAVHIPALSRYIPHFAWNGSSSSRTGNSSSSLNRGERSVAPWEDVNTISTPRSNSEHPLHTPSSEPRNPVQNGSIWGLARENPSSSGNVPFASQAGPSSGIHSLQPTPARIPPQRISELAPWSLFPPIEFETASHGGSFPLLPTGPPISSSEAVAAPSGSSSRSHRPRPRRSGLLSERQSDNLLHMHHLGRSIAANHDGRHRLISEIREVLNSMRRGENLRIEDYMVFDPLIYHDMAEIHDRHRDLRLDVDNMSYEELLALEERIGDVNTGLSKETIMQLMKHHKYTCIGIKSDMDAEPCCICQEEYDEGDDLGTLDCGHGFHTNCIKQWIMLKNLCPICKTTGLSPQ